MKRTIASLHELAMEVVGMQGLAPAGPLYVRYHSVGPMVDLEAGIPLAQRIEARRQVMPGTLPGGPALCTIHAGRTADLHRTVRALLSSCEASGLVAMGGYWECYLAQPTPDDDHEPAIAIYLPVMRLRRTRGSRSRGDSRHSPEPSRCFGEGSLGEIVLTHPRATRSTATDLPPALRGLSRAKA